MGEQGSGGERVEAATDDCENEGNSSRNEMVARNVGAIWYLKKGMDWIGLLHYLYCYGYLFSSGLVFVAYEHRLNDA